MDNTNAGATVATIIILLVIAVGAYLVVASSGGSATNPATPGAYIPPVSSTTLDASTEL